MPNSGWTASSIIAAYLTMVPGKCRSRLMVASALVDPLGYIDFLCMMDHATLVVTDSGGIQEETTSLGVPCVTVRENTERPVTIEMGTNVLAGTTSEGIRRATRKQLESKAIGKTPQAWDGKSAERILAVICRELEKKIPAEVA